MKRRIGTVTAMMLCMGVTPLALTLVIVKSTETLTEAWSPESFGLVFAVLHFLLFIAGAWIYATKVGN